MNNSGCLDPRARLPTDSRLPLNRRARVFKAPQNLSLSLLFSLSLSLASRAFLLARGRLRLRSQFRLSDASAVESSFPLHLVRLDAIPRMNYAVFVLRPGVDFRRKATAFYHWLMISFCPWARDFCGRWNSGWGMEGIPLTRFFLENLSRGNGTFQVQDYVEDMIIVRVGHTLWGNLNKICCCFFHFLKFV